MKTDSLGYFQKKFELFSVQPLPKRWELIQSKNFILGLIAFILIPLFMLAILDGKFLNANKQNSLLFDISIYIRFFISLPLLMIIPKTTGPGIRRAILHFTDSNLIYEGDKKKFEKLIETTLRLRDSMIAKLILVSIVIILSFIISSNYSDLFVETWRTHKDNLSLPGAWFFFVCQPIFHFFILYFLYRGILWWRFLYRTSRLRLNLTASNADGSGGLAFLAFTVKAFNIPILALSSSMAASAINMTIYEGISYDVLKIIVGSLIIFLSFFVIGPLLFFTPKLMKLKRDALYQYGKLSCKQMTEFEHKWINSKTPSDDYLESNDFSAAADSMAVVKQVIDMNVVPFNPKSLIFFFLAILVPFLPVIALKVDWRIILKDVLQILL